MILDQFKLTGKAAIVTGASKGLGLAMAEGLAEAGADVAVVARGDLGEARARVEATGRRCVEIRADLAKKGAVETIVREAREGLGRIDILVNNAGTSRRAPMLDYKEEDWDAVVDLNLKATFLLAQAVGRVFVEQGSGGKIINVASMLSFQGGILSSPYTASKSGVVGLTRLMANELAPLGINANAIAPGYMATDLTAEIKNDPKRNPSIMERIPAGRWGDPADMKGATVFLASGASDYVNGFTLAVDGGWLAR